jgi:hypothetical protein
MTITVSVPFHNKALLALAATFLTDCAALVPDAAQSPIISFSDQPIATPTAEPVTTLEQDVATAEAEFSAEDLAALQAFESEPVSNVVQMIPPPPVAAPVEEVPDNPDLRLLPSAAPYTYQQWLDAGWTEDSLIQGGKMLAFIPKPPTPAALPAAAEHATTAPTASTPSLTIPPPPITNAVAKLGGDVKVDALGLPWDARIHSEGRTFIADGSWRLKKGISQDLVASVKAELLALVNNVPVQLTGGVQAILPNTPPPPKAAPTPIEKPQLPAGVDVTPQPQAESIAKPLVKQIMAAINLKTLTQQKVLEVLSEHKLVTMLDITKAEHADKLPAIQAKLFGSAS